VGISRRGFLGRAGKAAAGAVAAHTIGKASAAWKTARALGVKGVAREGSKKVAKDVAGDQVKDRVKDKVVGMFRGKVTKEKVHSVSLKSQINKARRIRKLAKKK